VPHEAEAPPDVVLGRVMQYSASQGDFTVPALPQTMTRCFSGMPPQIRWSSPRMWVFRRSAAMGIRLMILRYAINFSFDGAR
jgi:hypothetical protein